MLVPLVADRTERTRVAVWLYVAPGTPESADGWYRVAEDVRPGWGAWMWQHGFSAGYHAAVMQVSEDGVEVDGWQQSPACMVYVEVR